MIKIYTKNCCDSSYKVKKWLKKYQLEFKEVNLSYQILDSTSFIHILKLSKRGTKDIIAERSDIYRKLRKTIDFEKLQIKELFDLVQQYPKLLRTPIIIDERYLQIGFNDREIRVFIPKDYRRIAKNFYQEHKEFSNLM